MKILFQGDSITDVRRDYEDRSSFGEGYALITTATLGAKYPQKFSFLNFGWSGNHVQDVYHRIERDGWRYSPDLMSLLIGVNDVWHELDEDNGKNIDVKRFETDLRRLVTETMEKLPGIKIVLMAPFLLKGPATLEHWDKFSSEVKNHADAVERVAKDLGLHFLPLQDLFDDACTRAPEVYWAFDGVHPTPAGHKLIADRWIQYFEENIMDK